MGQREISKHEKISLTVTPKPFNFKLGSSLIASPHIFACIRMSVIWTSENPKMVDTCLDSIGQSSKFSQKGAP